MSDSSHLLPHPRATLKSTLGRLACWSWRLRERSPPAFRQARRSLLSPSPWPDQVATWEEMGVEGSHFAFSCPPRRDESFKVRTEPVTCDLSPKKCSDRSKWEGQTSDRSKWKGQTALGRRSRHRAGPAGPSV